MSTPNDGGPIASALTLGNDGSMVPVGGISLRDWFAGMAVSGSVEYANFHESDHATTAAGYAYQVADAMLAARDRKEEE